MLLLPHEYLIVSANYGKHVANSLPDTHQHHHVPVLPAPILHLIQEVRHKNVAVRRQEVVVALLVDTNGPLHVNSQDEPPWYVEMVKGRP